jgi:hypothetical protein
MLAAEIDRAIREPKDDRLGLQPFADGLAGTLLADDGRTARGVVLGLERLKAWVRSCSSGRSTRTARASCSPAR